MALVHGGLCQGNAPVTLVCRLKQRPPALGESLHRRQGQPGRCLQLAAKLGSAAPHWVSRLSHADLPPSARAAQQPQEPPGHGPPGAQLRSQALGIVLSAALSLSVTSTSSPALAQQQLLPRQSQEVAAVQRTLKEAWGQVKSLYYDPSLNHLDWDTVLQESLAEAGKAPNAQEAYVAMASMLARLDDQFTRIVPPSKSSAFHTDTTGQLVHVGIRVEEVGEEAREVTFVADGSAAERAGIRQGDRLLAINGKPAGVMSGRSLALQLRQEADLSLERPPGPGQAQAQPGAAATQFAVRVTPEPIEVNPVLSNTFLGYDGSTIGYVRIPSFGQATGRHTERALRSLKAAGASSFIMDLRGNSGGIVNAGYEVARALLHSGDVFCHVSDRTGPAGDITVTDSVDPLTDEPMVVLVNSGTASTSEMLAGALEDHGRAVLVGGHTYGKGRTQKMVPLADGGMLLVSNTLITTPHHHRLDRVGLQPRQLCAPQPGSGEVWATGRADARALAQDPCVALAARHLTSATAPPAPHL